MHRHRDTYRKGKRKYCDVSVWRFHQAPPFNWGWAWDAAMGDKTGALGGWKHLLFPWGPMEEDTAWYTIQLNLVQHQNVSDIEWTFLCLTDLCAPKNCANRNLKTQKYVANTVVETHEYQEIKRFGKLNCNFSVGWTVLTSIPLFGWLGTKSLVVYCLPRKT